jgi:hypothetical protein
MLIELLGLLDERTGFVNMDKGKEGIERVLWSSTDAGDQATTLLSHAG